MLVIDFKKHILLNIKFFWKYLKNLTFRTKMVFYRLQKGGKLSNSYFIIFTRKLCFILKRFWIVFCSNFIFESTNQYS